MKKAEQFLMHQLFDDNQKQVEQYNSTLLFKFCITVLLATVIALISSFFFPHLEDSRLAYCLFMLVIFGMITVSRLDFGKKHALSLLYVVYAILVILSEYFAFFTAPNRPTVALLIVFVIFPTTVLDRVERMTAVNFAVMITHTALAYFFKPDAVGEDFANCFVAAFLGTFIGYISMEFKLKAMDFERLLILEKETDVVTGLYNRRKLFETMKSIERKETSLPDGVIMLDIDNFKQYNDSYGHLMGDEFLKRLGTCLGKENRDCKVTFFRYGGDEFCAFVWGAGREKILSVAEEICSEIRMSALEKGLATVSVGSVFCDQRDILNMEIWIEQADIALYAAKQQGKGVSVEYNDRMLRFPEHTENPSDQFRSFRD